MNQASNRRKKWLYTILALAIGIPVGCLALKVGGDRLNEVLISEKEYKGTRATVAAKEVVSFDRTNHAYINDRGVTIKAQPGDQQFRVYFYFDDFDGYDPQFRSELVAAEKKRIANGKPHFVWGNFNDRRLYDAVEVGDKLSVSYKAYSDSDIDILRAEKTSN